MYKNMWAQGFVHGPFIRCRLTNEMTRQRYTEVWSSPLDLHAYDRQSVIVYWDRDDLDSPAVIIDPRTGDYICEAEHFEKPGTFLCDDMSGMRIVHEWESFNVTMYGNMKKFIPSLQKPEGLRSRQAEVRREERRRGHEPTVEITGTPADTWTPADVMMRRIKTREEMLAAG
jgi:hypothetical protein